MNTTEFKVGQKWRVVDALGVGYSTIVNGDILTVQEVDCDGDAYTEEGLMVLDQQDILAGNIELIDDTQEASTETSEDVSPAWASSVPEDVKSVSQVTTDSLNSKDILWHIISRAETFNGHSQFSVSDMDLDTLMRLTRMLDDYVEEFCELRLSWGGDHMGYYTADIYEIAGTCSDGDDKILMQVEKVTGI